MSFLFPVAGLWLAFLFGAAAFLARRRPCGRLFQVLALVALSLAGVLFLWWAMCRTLAAL